MRLAEIDAFVGWLERQPALQAEAGYVELFDRGRATSLHLFEHVHGDSRDRGAALVDLAQTYAQAGLDLSGRELPDFLPVVLEFASTQPPERAREFVAETGPALARLFSALVERQSPYAAVVGAVLDLGGLPTERVSVPAEPTIDEDWIEPEAFAGCSFSGQSSPATQPIHFVRQGRPAAAREGAASVAQPAH